MNRGTEIASACFDIYARRVSPTLEHVSTGPTRGRPTEWQLVRAADARQGGKRPQLPTALPRQSGGRRAGAYKPVIIRDARGHENDSTSGPENCRGGATRAPPPFARTNRRFIAIYSRHENRGRASRVLNTTRPRGGGGGARDGARDGEKETSMPGRKPALQVAARRDVPHDFPVVTFESARRSTWARTPRCC